APWPPPPLCRGFAERGKPRLVDFGLDDCVALGRVRCAVHQSDSAGEPPQRERIKAAAGNRIANPTSDVTITIATASTSPMACVATTVAAPMLRCAVPNPSTSFDARLGPPSA